MAKGQMANRQRIDRQRIIKLPFAIGLLPLAICLLLACAVPVLAQPAIPQLTERVIDQADILSSATENTLIALLKAHEDSTSNQIAVLTIPSLEGASIESYSIEVAQTWGLGTAENDNGVLLLVAVGDREMRIEVGQGLEGDLTDAIAGRIIRNEITPRFRSGDFDGGVLAGARGIIGVIEGTYSPSEASASSVSEEMPPFWVGLLFLLIPSVFAVIGVFLPGCFRWMLFFFLMPFYWACGFMITGSEIGGVVILVIYSILYVAAQFHPKVKAVHKKYGSGVGSFVGAGSGSGSSWSSSSSSSWSSSSSSSWSSSSSSFSGGGGSFGGGGASGSW